MIAIPDGQQLQIIEEKTTDVMTRAEQLIIDSQERYDACAGFLKVIKGLQKEVDETFDKNIKDAHQLHKNMVASKKKHSDPLDRAETIIKSKTITWIREQERIKQEAQRKADEEARKAEEKRKAELEAQAKAWEAKGNGAKAEERREQAAQVLVPRPEIQDTFEKAGGQAIKTLWKAEVTDLVALCKAIADGTLPPTMVTPNMTTLNALARTMKDSKKYPGIRFYSEDSLLVRR